MPKLTARQRKFLKLASEPDGCCPFDMPPGGPYLKTHEIEPLTRANLCVFCEDYDVWDITDAGKRALETGEIPAADH